MNPRFHAPTYIDSRPLCIQASNQGQEPSCAGYTQAGYKEIQHWRTTGEMKQFDGDECYRVAKTLDGMPRQEGTSLVAAAQAAQQLGWIPGTHTDLRAIMTLDELKYALHMYGAAPAGFAIDSNWNTVHTKTGFIADGKNPRPLGGHAVLVCYYDKDSVGFQNSWGTGWGYGGFGRMTWAQAHKQFMYALAIEKPWLRWRA